MNMSYNSMSYGSKRHHSPDFLMCCSTTDVGAMELRNHDDSFAQHLETVQDGLHANADQLLVLMKQQMHRLQKANFLQKDLEMAEIQKENARLRAELSNPSGGTGESPHQIHSCGGHGQAWSPPSAELSKEADAAVATDTFQSSEGGRHSIFGGEGPV